MGTRRLLERIAAIMSIILGGLSLMGAMIMIPYLDMLIDEMNAAYLESGVDITVSKGAYVTSLVISAIIAAAQVVLGALLLRRKKTRTFTLAVGIPLCAVNGIMAVLSVMSLSEAFMALVYGAALVLGILALTMKDQTRPQSDPSISVTYMGPQTYVDPGTLDPFDGRPAPPAYRRPTRTVIDPFAEEPTASDKDTIDAKIRDLRRLRDIGAISEEQYSAAVDKLIKEAAGEGNKNAEKTAGKTDSPADRHDDPFDK